MERCPKCGAELPPVAYYCPICGANLAESRAAQPDQQPEERPGPQFLAEEIPAAPEAWRVTPVTGVQMLGPAFMAGIAGGVLVGVPGTSSCGCLWMLGCGALAVFFFHKQFGRSTLPNEAARLGVLTGFFGFVVAFFVAFVSFALIRRHLTGLVDALRENMERSARMVKPEDAQQLLDMINSPGGAVVLLVMLAGVYFVSFLAFGTLGALLAGSVWHRREQ